MDEYRATDSGGYFHTNVFARIDCYLAEHATRRNRDGVWLIDLIYQWVKFKIIWPVLRTWYYATSITTWTWALTTPPQFARVTKLKRGHTCAWLLVTKLEWWRHMVYLVPTKHASDVQQSVFCSQFLHVTWAKIGFMCRYPIILP